MARYMAVDPRPGKESAYFMIVDIGKDDKGSMGTGILDDLTDAMALSRKKGIAPEDVLIDCSTRRQEVYNVASLAGFTVVRASSTCATGDMLMDVGTPVRLIRRTASGGKGYGEYGPAQDCYDVLKEWARYKANLVEAGVVLAPSRLSVEQKAERYDALVEYIFELLESEKSTLVKAAECIISAKGLRPC